MVPSRCSPKRSSHRRVRIGMALCYSTAKGARTPTWRFWKPLLCHSSSRRIVPSVFFFKLRPPGIEPGLSGRGPEVLPLDDGRSRLVRSGQRDARGTSAWAKRPSCSRRGSNPGFLNENQFSCQLEDGCACGRCAAGLDYRSHHIGANGAAEMDNIRIMTLNISDNRAQSQENGGIPGNPQNGLTFLKIPR
jgi:hypothetical protein